MNPMTFFASGDGPHISLSAEEVITIGGYSVTNSMVYGAIFAISVMLIGLWMARKIKVRPVKGVVQIFEIIVDFLIDMMTDVFGSREKGVRYAPIFGTFFMIIVLSNLSGLLPIVGNGIFTETADGVIPFFRPFTADLNATLAMALVAILTVQVLSIRESGIKGHLKHYFTDKPFNPINLFIGVLEIFGELVRVMSLALRLFLNTVVGEILIAVFIWVGRDAAPLVALPIIMFEILVAFIQAYVFTVLSATYLALAIAHHGEHEEDHQADVAINKVEKAPSPA
jgi:F-type H+-transporting ATPase subunit a